MELLNMLIGLEGSLRVEYGLFLGEGKAGTDVASESGHLYIANYGAWDTDSETAMLQVGCLLIMSLRSTSVDRKGGKQERTEGKLQL